MVDWLQTFITTFVPLFIVIDALGNLPVVISLTEKLSATERRRVVHIGSATATILGLVFLFLGQLILNVLGISVGSFAIAGGIILLVLSIKYMTSGRMVHAVKEEMIAVVPIGTPLVVGPATITTLLLLSNEYPIYMVLLSFIINMLISWTIFMSSEYVIKVLKPGGLKAISKIFSLLLAAIAVSMIIHGLVMVGLTSTAG